MRKEKQEFLDEEIALKKKEGNLTLTLYEWTKTKGGKETAMQQTSSRTFIALSTIDIRGQRRRAMAARRGHREEVVITPHRNEGLPTGLIALAQVAGEYRERPNPLFLSLFLLLSLN
ncbi:hypothetical protein GCK32_019736, partial [Trichostrongylus colubriformis]